VIVGSIIDVEEGMKSFSGGKKEGRRKHEIVGHTEKGRLVDSQAAACSLLPR
jgi:hypothetical protein